MFFRTTLFVTLALLSGSYADKTLPKKKIKSFVPKRKLSTKSKAGKRLLSKARQLNDDRDVTWVANYDIKYTGCSSLVQVREEGGGGDEGMLYTQNLAKFSLCPAGEGCSCKYGAEYVVNMREFLDAYTEFKMEENEQKCEYVRETCYCNNNNNNNNGNNDEDSCLYQCYIDQGLEGCIEYEGQEEFEIQQYIECAEMEEGNNDNNNNYNYYNYDNGNNGNANNYNGNNNNANWYGQYFVGPYCSEKDGYSIHLGVFYDEQCTSRGDASAYADRHYGASLPFASEPLVQSECISCMQIDQDNNNNYNYNNYNNGNNNNNNNNNNYNYYQDLEVNQYCEQVYEDAAKCESNLNNVQYKDSTGCDYIQNILPKLEGATRSVQNGKSKAPHETNPRARALAWVFAATTVIFASYAFFLYRKLSRGRVNLSNQGNGGAMA